MSNENKTEITLSTIDLQMLRQAHAKVGELLGSLGSSYRRLEHTKREVQLILDHQQQELAVLDKQLDEAEKLFTGIMSMVAEKYGNKDTAKPTINIDTGVISFG
jgi:hypothetical protein